MEPQQMTKSEVGTRFSERESCNLDTKHLGYKIKVYVVLSLSTAVAFKHNY